MVCIQDPSIFILHRVSKNTTNFETHLTILNPATPPAENVVIDKLLLSKIINS